MMALKKVHVIKGLEDVTLWEKEACTFDVTLSHAYIRGVWARNGVQLKSKPTCRIAAHGKSHSLTLTRTSLSDMGRISFCAEGVETSAILTVTARDIEIVKHLEDVSVIERETLTLVCEVNLEDVDGKWFKNNVRVRDGGNVKIRHECMTHSLTLKAIKPEDAGEITFTAERVSSSAVLCVKELPVQFVKPLRVKIGLYKYRALLECQLSRANAEVTWYKRSRKIMPRGRYRLVSESVYRQLIIDEVGSSDEDIFICDAGDAKTSCRLFVEEQAISIVRGLSSVEVMEPKEACFRVETNLKSEREPKWTLNGELLTNSPEVRIGTEGTLHKLTFTNTNSSMCGTVQFSSGKSRSMAQLTVKERPLVVTQPISDAVVKENGSVTLSCGFYPSPRVVRWFKGRTLLGASSKYRIGQEKNHAEMTIMGVKTTDSGEYRCLAGGAESRSRVNVEVERLKITQHLEQVEVEEDGTALFCCELSHEVSSVQWLLNDRVLHTSHMIKIQNTGKVHTLLLKRLTPQVSRVTFKMMGLSETAILRVKERPAVFVRSLEDVVAEERDKVCLRCEVSKQAVIPVWKKDGIVLTASEKYQMLHLGKSLRLIIHELRKDDAGEYTCDVETSQTKSKVSVRDLPVTIVRRLRTAMVLEGENCSFECFLSHDIIDEASWILNGQLIVSSDRIQVTNEGCRYTLQIHEVMVCDAGDVVFTIKDLTCRTMLFVKEKPVRIFRDMLNVKATPGEDAELSCEITKPEVPVKWLKNGRLIRVNPKYEISQKGYLAKMIIHNVTVWDSGEYYCEANGIGTRARLEVRDFQHTFATELKDMQAEEKSKVVLECEVKTSVGRVSWLKGMMVLSPGEKYLMRKNGVILSLTIFNLKKSDSDLYTCDVGAMQTRAFLTVHGQKVTIMDELQDTECLEGETVTFTCRICPNDFTEVKWYLDETLLYTNDLNEIKMTPGGYHILTIQKLACKDTGTISFEAGGKRSYASLLVRERRPTIIKALEDTEAIEGGRLVLLCRTSKPCHILWYKDGCLVWSSSNRQMSRSGNEAWLTILQVKDTDAGEYSCVTGSVSTTATVTVKAVPAEFTKLLQSEEAKEGSSVTLCCEFSVPGIQYVWRKGPETLRSGKKYLMKQKNNSISLTIHNVNLEDSGTYTCVCRNQSTTGTITVHAIPITFVKQLKDQQSEEGGNVTLRCELSRSGELVQWLREQEALSPGGKYRIRQIVTIQELVIKSPVPEDSGTYSCVCTDQRTQATVTIRAQPITFTQKLKTQLAEEGDSVTLHCELSKPGLPVEWRKDDELLRSREKYQMRQRGAVLEMKILYLRCEDSATYSCSCGTAYTSARVTVSRQLISFKEKLKNQVSEEGKSLTLHCELSKPGATVQWWKGEKLLQAGLKYQMKERDTSYELVITDAAPEDSGVYTCVCGDQKSKATIRVVGVAATFRKNLKNQEAPEGGSVMLRCELSKSRVPVEWWKGEDCLMPGGRYQMRQDGNVTELEITDVLPEDVGVYSCVTGNQKTSAELKIKALPITFKRELLDQVSKEGGITMFTCELSKPGAPVEWRKGRVFLKPGAKYKMKQEGSLTKLVIHDVEEGDSGKYTCKTKDAQSTAELTVQALPAFFRKVLTNQEAQEGNSISLHCELSKPGARLDWWKAGEILRTGEKYQLRHRGLTAELLIRRAEPEDTGVYRCVCAEQSTEAFIKVNAYPITFKQELKNHEAVEGSNVTLCCELSKAGAQTQWWKGEKLLTHGEKYQLRQIGTKVEFVIRKAVPEDSGIYMCTCQHQRSKATIIINALPPTFKQNLRNQEIVEGNSVTLRCELSKPGASVNWWKGQELLTLGEKYSMKIIGRISEMIIRNVETGDSGSYSCTVGCERTTSELKVQALPVTFKQELQNEVANVGGTALFCCELSKPGAPVDWRKGRVILKAGDKYEMKQEGNITNLIIDNIEESDAGTYSCKTKDSESNAELLVRVSPITFKMKLKDQEVEEGSTVSLRCELSRTNVPVKWQKGDKLLTHGPKYQIREQAATVELIIKNATTEDSGVFTCICGAQKTKATIKVSATPVTFRQLLMNQEAPEGGAIVLHCELSKAGAPVQWLKEEEELNNGAKYKMKQEGLVAELHIKNVLPMDVGKYSCVIGDQKTTAEVNVRAAASAFFEKGLQNQAAVEGSGVVFSCLLSTSNVPVTWKKDSRQIKQGGRFVFRQEGATQELEIRQLRPEDAGIYTCVTRGKTTSATLRVTERVRIVRELQDVTVTAGEDAHFVCELSHEGITDGVWWLGSNVLQENEMNQMSCCGREHHLLLTMMTPEESSIVAFVVRGERTEAHLRVNCKPKVLIEEKLKDIVVFEGDTATLSCVTSDTCTPVTWKRNSITLLSGEKYELRKEGKRNILLIHRVGQEDAGVYICDTGNLQSAAALTVKECPLFFREGLQNQQAEEGESAVLFCKLSRPGAAVHWKKGAVLLEHGQKYEKTQDGCELQLQIYDLMIQDSGVYTCCVDAVESKASLAVKERPLFFCKELQSVEVEEGDTAFLSCELSKPGTAVHWKKGTVFLRPGSKYEMKQDGCELELQIRDLKYQDSGIYKCCAGVTVETKANILVKECPLYFREHLQSQQVVEGDTVFLSCELSKPGVAVQWKKGTLLLESGGKDKTKRDGCKQHLVIHDLKYKIKQDGCKQHLIIHDLKAQDSGTYKCYTGNLVTTASIKVTEQPLFFQKELKSVEAVEGETALLCCELSKPGVLVHWKKEMVLLKPADKYEMIQDGCKFQLLIHDLTSQDNGTYSCCAESLITTSTLYVKEQPLFFYKELKSQKAEVGETVWMCCELSKPGVAVLWKKESQVLKPGDKYEMKQEGCKQQLYIYHLKHQDCGTYKCCAGSLVTTACLEVKDYAWFSSEEPRSLEAEEGEIDAKEEVLTKPKIIPQVSPHSSGLTSEVSTKPRITPQVPPRSSRLTSEVSTKPRVTPQVIPCSSGLTSEVSTKPLITPQVPPCSSDDTSEVSTKPRITPQVPPCSSGHTSEVSTKPRITPQVPPCPSDDTSEVSTKPKITPLVPPRSSSHTSEVSTKPMITPQVPPRSCGHTSEVSTKPNITPQVPSRSSGDTSEVSTKPKITPQVPLRSSGHTSLQGPVADGQNNVLGPKKPTVGQNLGHDHLDHHVKRTQTQDLKKKTLMRQKKEDEKPMLTQDVNEPTHSEEEFNISFPAEHGPTVESSKKTEISAVNLTETSASLNKDRSIEEVEKNTLCRDPTDQKSETQNKSILIELPCCKIKFIQPSVQEQHSAKEISHGLEPKKQDMVVESSVRTTSMDFSVTFESEQLDPSEKRTEEKNATRKTLIKHHLKDEKPDVHTEIHSEPDRVSVSGAFEKTLPKHVEKKATIGTILDQKCGKQDIMVKKVPEMSSKQSSQQKEVQARQTVPYTSITEQTVPYTVIKEQTVPYTGIKEQTVPYTGIEAQTVPYTGITEQTNGIQATEMEKIPETQSHDLITEQATKVKLPGTDTEKNTISGTRIDQKSMTEHIIAREILEESFKQFSQEVGQNVPHMGSTQKENRKQVTEKEKVPVVLITQPQSGTAEQSNIEACKQINVHKAAKQVKQTNEVTKSPKHSNLSEVILVEHSQDTSFIEKGTEEESEMLEAAVKIQAAFKGFKARKDMRPVFKEVFKNQNVDLSGTVRLECVTESKVSTVRWLKDGVDLTSDKRYKISHTEGGRCILVIPNVILKDAGIYTCEVSNKFGAVSYNGNVTVGHIKNYVSETLQRPATKPVLEKETVQTFKDKQVPKLVCDRPADTTCNKIQDQRKVASPSDDNIDPDAVISQLSWEEDVGKSLDKAQFLQSLDEQMPITHRPLRTLETLKEKGNGAAIRTSSHKFSHTSVNMESLSDSDVDEDRAESFDIYVAKVDCQPTEGDKEPFILKEGQFVEVLESVRPDKWLVRTRQTRTTPSHQGWLCPAYLEKKTKEQFSMAHEQETKDNSDKSTKISYKGKYRETVSEVIKNLLDSETEFVREMNFFVAHHLEYNSKPSLSIFGQKEHTFHNIKTIASFHKNCFLPKLRGCFTDDDVAQCFVNHTHDFKVYVQYILEQSQAEACISDISTQLDTEGFCISTYLQKPLERIQMYQTLLKELIRNKAKLRQSCCLLEDAFSMVGSLPWRAENLQHVSLIESYPAPLRGLGEPVRQGAFTVWEEAPGSKVSLRGHRRHLFLFKDCVVFCKPQRDMNTHHEVYVFKNKMKLSDIELKDTAEGDERSWSMWHEHRGSVRQVTVQARAVAVRLSWLRDLRDLQQCWEHPQCSAPCFELLLTDSAAKLGQTIKLVCKVTGNPKPVITWYKDGAAVVEDRHCAVSAGSSGVCCIVLASVNEEDSGQYMCYATSPMGNASTLAKLTVDTPPHFTTKLEDTVLERGRDIRLQCSTACLSLPTVRWFKDSAQLRNSHKYEIHSDVQTGVLILDIKEVEETDLGQYECELLNQMGSAKCKAQLYSTPPHVPDSSRDQSQVASAPDTQSDSWSGALVKNLFHMLFQSGHSTQSVAGSSHAQTSDTQEVKEKQQSDPEDKTSVVSEAAEDIWPAPPEVHVAMEDLLVKPGAPAEFSVLITGQPSPEVMWYKDGVALSTGKQIECGLRYCLTLQAVGVADCGTYTCTATNGSGHASCHAQLTVDAGPEDFEDKKVEGENKREVEEVCRRRKLHSVYNVHEEIGRGTFGVVKRITHRGSGEEFAAKFIPLRRDTRTSAYQERDLLSRLHHWGLACLLDGFCTGHTLVLVTEICSSQGLLERLILKASVTERQVQIYIQQILHAVEYIHSMNILHLDIKTDNILMVSPEREEVKICDFGLCQEIDPSRHQYSVFGTPEFVAPEIVRREPVTVATDTWSVGVVAYLCLTGHCPFFGENDRVTLAKVAEGVLHWGVPELCSRSQQAQDFLRSVLQPDPGMRLSASQCLSHRWFEGQYSDDELDNINTKNLKSFISRRKWQRSLTCLGSVLTLRSIPDLLDAPLSEVSITTPRDPHKASSTSASSASSSEYDETDSWDFFQPASHEEDEDEEEYNPYAHFPAQTSALQKDEQDVGLGQERPQRKPLLIPINKPLIEASKPVSREQQGGSPILLVSEGNVGVASGRPIPRGSLIKSSFYNSSQQLSPISARHLALQHELHGRNQNLDRGRKPLRFSPAGRVNEPLIEYAEDSPDAEAARRHRSGSVPKPCSVISSSMVSGASPISLNQRRSRSLDKSMRCSTASKQERKLGDDEQNGHEEVTDKEADYSPEVLVKNMSRRQSVALQNLSLGAVAKVTSQTYRTVIEQQPISTGFHTQDSQSQPGEEESAALEGEENVAGSQLSLAESSVLGPDSEVSSRDRCLDGVSGSPLPVSQRHRRHYNNSEGCLFTLSSGKPSECSLFLNSEDEEVRVLHPSLPTRRAHSSETCAVLSSERDAAQRRSSCVPHVLPAPASHNAGETLQRHSSAPVLQVTPTGGKSHREKSHGAGLLKIFRRQSWTESSERTEATCPQRKAPLMDLKNKMRASASSLTRLFSRQHSQEDKEEKRGSIVKSPVPPQLTSVTSGFCPSDTSSASPQKKPKLFSIKLPSFRKCKEASVRPPRPDVVQLAGGGVLVFWKPVLSSGTGIYCIQYSVNGVDWRMLSNNVTDSCYVVTSLPNGMGYVFRVACVTKKSFGPFSEPSPPAFMTVPYEDSHIPLILTESAGSKVRVPGGLGSERTFKFLSEINRGRSSVVMQCEDSRSPGRLAAKFTPYGPEQRQLVLGEYQVLRQLHHPHLVHLYAAILSPTCLVLVEELCSGPELLHHLANKDVYAEEEVTELLRQVLAGVDYLHGHHIIHLDLRSDNMLVTEGGLVKIVDMGSAQRFSPGHALTAQHIKEMTHSTVYIVLPKAPEILEGHGVEPSTDIWALGLLTFIMLSADSPFHAELSWEKDRNIRKGKIQFGRCYPGLSEGAINFLKRTLNNKAWGRPSAAECLQDPWVLGAQDPSTHRASGVSFSTHKLQAFLRDREAKRNRARTKVQLPLA